MTAPEPVSEPEEVPGQLRRAALAAAAGAAGWAVIAGPARGPLAAALPLLALAALVRAARPPAGVTRAWARSPERAATAGGRIDSAGAPVEPGVGAWSTEAPHQAGATRAWGPVARNARLAALALPALALVAAPLSGAWTGALEALGGRVPAALAWVGLVLAATAGAPGGARDLGLFAALAIAHGLRSGQLELSPPNAFALTALASVLLLTRRAPSPPARAVLPLALALGATASALGTASYLAPAILAELRTPAARALPASPRIRGSRRSPLTFPRPAPTAAPSARSPAPAASSSPRATPSPAPSAPRREDPGARTSPGPASAGPPAFATGGAGPGEAAAASGPEPRLVSGAESRRQAAAALARRLRDAAELSGGSSDVPVGWLLLAAALALVAAVARLARAAPPPRAPASSCPTDKSFRGTVELLARRGVHREPGETPHELAARAQDSLGPLDGLTELVELHVEARYRPEGLTPAKQQRAAELAAAVLRQLSISPPAR